jgi:hypothetical protein
MQLRGYHLGAAAALETRENADAAAAGVAEDRLGKDQNWMKWPSSSDELEGLRFLNCTEEQRQALRQPARILALASRRRFAALCKRLRVLLMSCSRRPGEVTTGEV